MQNVPPAVVVTVYPTGGSMARVAQLVRPQLERLARAAAPGDLVVCVHDPINGDEKPILDLVRALGLRLWVAWGANPHVRTARAHGVAAAARVVEQWARAAAAAGAEVLEPNGERDGRNPGTDWVIDQPGDAELLPELARAVVAACRRGAPGRPVSFTSHDCPKWHRLPWGVLCAPVARGGVDYLALQYYACDPRDDAPETHHDARRRVAMATAQLRDLVQAGVVCPELGPGGTGWTPYGQVHGLTAAGAAIVLDAADTVRAWALPQRVDAAGLDALEAVLVARRETGRRAGALARLQAREGLTPDGVLGEATKATVRRLLAV